MNLKLFEVAGTHIFSMSAIVMVLFFVFAIIVVGYLLGKINIKAFLWEPLRFSWLRWLWDISRAWRSARTASLPGLLMLRRRTLSTSTSSLSRVSV
ncbi:MAG: hypothetical protein ACLR5S_04975 [Ruminococcus sp.]